jgi:hypothetical protein
MTKLPEDFWSRVGNLKPKAFAPGSVIYAPSRLESMTCDRQYVEVVCNTLMFVIATQLVPHPESDIFPRSLVICKIEDVTRIGWVNCSDDMIVIT